MTGLMCVNFSAQAQADADAVHGFVAPVGMTLVGVSVYPEAFTGTPTGFNIDVNVGETEVVKALAANTAGTAGDVVEQASRRRQYGGGDCEGRRGDDGRQPGRGQHADRGL